MERVADPFMTRYLSPTGFGNSLRITPNGLEMNYAIPIEFDLPDELAREYDLYDKKECFETLARYHCENTGWVTHNADPPLPILYKNVIILLNNAAVKQKYGSL